MARVRNGSRKSFKISGGSYEFRTATVRHMNEWTAGRARHVLSTNSSMQVQPCNVMQIFLYLISSSWDHNSSCYLLRIGIETRSNPFFVYRTCSVSFADFESAGQSSLIDLITCYMPPTEAHFGKMDVIPYFAIV